MANWRIAIVQAEHAAHELAKLQALEASQAAAVDPATAGGKQPLQWSGGGGDPLGRGRYVDIYDAPR